MDQQNRSYDAMRKAWFEWHSDMDEGDVPMPIAFPFEHGWNCAMNYASKEKPLWKDGEPQNLQAAASDAKKWLDTIHPRDAKNRERLALCKRKLQFFIDA